MNHRLTRPLCPPSWLAAMSWTRWLPPGVAWTTWLVMQDLMLLGALLLCLGWWTPLGRGPPLAFVAAAAAMGAVPTALDEGAPIFLLLLLWVGALSRPDRPWQSGVLLGLSALVSARSWLLIPLWMARRQWQSLAIAAVSFGMGSALTLPLLGVGVHTTFWTEVLPDLLTGDFTGLGLRIDVFGNLAPAHVFATIWPGPTGQILSPVAVGLGWLWGLGVVGTLAWLHRVRSADPWNEAAVAASWLVALVLVPTFGLELHLPLTLPAIALAIGALWTGRLAPAWLVPIGIATAVLLYPVVPLRSLYQAILLPDAPWAAPLLREAKMGALLLLFGAIVVLSTSPRE